MRVDDFVKRTHCWDYIFDLNSFKNDSYGVYPIVNLVMNIGAYGVHTNASVLKLVEGFFGERHYPFAPKHKGVFTKRFNRKGIKIFVGTELLFISEEYCKTIISICDINKSITR